MTYIYDNIQIENIFFVFELIILIIKVLVKYIYKGDVFLIIILVQKVRWKPKKACACAFWAIFLWKCQYDKKSVYLLPNLMAHMDKADKFTLKWSLKFIDTTFESWFILI